MSEARTHYDVLGLPPDATPEEIKKRYRELARQHHPDLNRDRPHTHEIFLQINKAYEVLGNPAQRASYDLLLRDRARRESDRRSYQVPGSGANRGPAPTGYGGTGADARPSAQAASEAERRRRYQQIVRMMEDARQAFSRGHLRAAQRICLEVLELHRGVGAAYELLGDIYARQGRVDEALEQYTQAAQRLPNNSLVMAKYNRLLSRSGLGGGGQPVSPASRVAQKLAMTFMGGSITLVLLTLWPHLQDRPMGLFLVPSWSLTQFAFTILVGLVCGITLAAPDWIRPFNDELLNTSPGVARRPVTLAHVVVMFGLVFWLMALFVYLAIAVRLQAISRSVLGIFGVTFLLTLGFSLTAPPPAQIETFLFSGNLLLLSLLPGWIIGDVLRPGWAAH